MTVFNRYVIRSVHYEKKLVDCFYTEYEKEKIVWEMIGATQDEPYLSGSVFIGEEGEIPIEEIKDDAFIVCRPCDGDDKWHHWMMKVADKLICNGVKSKDIKKEIATILFDGARKYKDRIKLNCDSEDEQIIEKSASFILEYSMLTYWINIRRYNI